MRIVFYVVMFALLASCGHKADLKLPDVEVTPPDPVDKPVNDLPDGSL